MAELALADPAPDSRPTSFALECLAFIGRRYGVSLSVEQLVKDNRLSSAAIDFAQLHACAERAGFRCRPVRARWSMLGELRGALPAIVRLTDGRHAVLTRAGGTDEAPTVTLLQPRDTDDGASVVLDQAGFEALWSGDVLLIKRSLGLAEKTRPFGIETVFGLLRGDRRGLRDLVVSTLVLSALSFTPILFAQLLLTEVLSYPAAGTFFFLCLGMLLLVLFEAGFTAVRQALLGRLGGRLERELSGVAFDHLLRLPVRWFESMPAGGITRRLEGVGSLAAGLASRAAGTLLDAAVALIAFPLLLVYAPLLSVVAGGFFVLLLVWTYLMGRKLAYRAAAVDKVEAERTAFLSENLGALGRIRAQMLDARQRQRWDVLTARATRLRLAEDGTANVLQSVATLLEWGMLFGTFALGVFMTDADTLPATLGYLFTFLLVAQRLAAPVRHLAPLVREAAGFRRAMAGVGALLDEAAEPGHGGHGVQLPLRGRIDFANVTFTYPGAPGPALQSVTFEVPAGGSLGITGRSGAGKTTIGRLLQKFHGDYQGLIKIDGIDVRDYDTEHLRGALGIVQQDTVLFAGTVRDAIAAAKPDASDEEVAHAARIAGAEAFIERLPLGYDTVLQEDGANLSDGERQRLAIARAVVAAPRVLILDEATSALDPEAEATVLANLRRFARGRTVITISHRFAALKGADAILVLDRGEVQDIGRHDELLERCDIYSGAWQRQKRLLDGPPAPEALLPRGSHVA